jgi:uncharacterized membrane protein YdjX (TVP38/TMEM64 family)
LLSRQSFATLSLVRLLPIAPYSLVNMVAGASHVPFRMFLAATLVGMSPGVLAITIFSNQLKSSLTDPGPWSFILLGLVSLLMVAGSIWLHRKFGSELAPPDPETRGSVEE